jgi:hypothetical protein
MCLSFPGRSAALLFLAAAALAPVSAQTVRLQAEFDAVTAPALPAGWTGAWVTSAASASSGSGGNNLADTGTGTAVATSASFDLTGVTSAQLTYLARRTSSYPAEVVSVVFQTAGGDFPVAGDGLPSASGSWESVSFDVPAGVLDQAGVSLQFESSGGTSSGANARIDDITVTTSGAPPPSNALGFAQTDIDALAGTVGLLVPLDLIWAGPDSLQGVQFELTSSGLEASVTGILRGAPLADLAAWTVSTEGTRTLVIANGNEGLPAGEYAPFLSAVLDLADVTDTTLVTLSLTGVVGAAAVPQGSDAGLVADPSAASVRILPRVGILTVPDSVSIGQVPVGGAGESTVWLGNEGSAALAAQVTVSPAGFSAAPSSLNIQPGDSVAVTVSFTPGVDDIGYQSGQLLVDGQPQIILTATGLVAWGDATDDGVVDVGDLVLGVDVALGRVSVSAAAVTSLDLYPFPLGDGAIDVRDLTVLTQAVLRGEWPNAVALPAGKSVVVSKLAAASTTAPGVRFLIDDSVLQLELARAVRGVQADLRFEGRATRLGQALISQRGNRLRVLWVPVYGSELPLGVHPIARLEDGAVDIQGVAIGLEGERIPITQLELPRTQQLRPYPNPFAPSQGVHLTLPVSQARVVDVLGREVWRGESPWNGKGRAGQLVSPGLYFVVSGGQRWSVVVTG